MRYALLIYCDDDTAAPGSDGRCCKEQFAAIRNQLRARSVLARIQWLLPSCAARVVRCWDGGDIVTSGPAAQTKEQLTGWIIAECEDLEAAVRLAATIPAAWHGSVEVRAAGETPT
jgi:hypothetical protein